MKLRDIMTTGVCCASPTDTVADVASEMKRHNVGIMPVCQNNSLIGIATDRDIVLECVATGSNPRDCKIGNILTSQLVHASPDMDLEEAVRLMGNEQIRRLPVVENGRLLGMVSIGDLAFHLRDDRIVAQLLRQISTPVRSFKAEPVAA